MPTSYRAEILFNGRTYSATPRETRELAAAEVPRLLGNPLWQENLSRPNAGSCSVRVVGLDQPADVHPLAGVSLAEFSEGLRRRLYDQVVADYFTPQLVVEEGEISISLPYSPDVAGLAVFYLQGRWFVGWNRLERKGGTVEDRSELSRIYSAERGIVYQEV